MIKHRLSTAMVVGATCVALSLGATPALAATATDGSASAQGHSERREGNFTDNPKGSPFYTPVRWMQKNDYAYGYTDGSFGKDKDIARGEAVAFIYRYYDPEDFEAEGEPFDDVDEDTLFYEAITWADDMDIAKGYADGDFKPGKSVTRGEFVAFVYRTLEPDFKGPKESGFDDVPKGSTHYKAIAWASARGIVNGYKDQTFRPNDQITRGEVAQIIYNGATKSW